MKKPEKNIVVWGGGGHGRVVIDLLRAVGGWNLFGVLDSINHAGAEILGVPVLGDADVLPSLKELGVTCLVAAVGDGRVREQMMIQGEQHGFLFPTIVHPAAQVFASAAVADGCVICAGAVVGTQTEVGPGCIINTGAVVDHNCHVGAYSHVAPAAALCGWVRVGARSWIGAGSIVRDHMIIGECVTVGVGSVVVKPIEYGAVVCGNPARAMR